MKSKENLLRHFYHHLSCAYTNGGGQEQTFSSCLNQSLNIALLLENKENEG